LSRGPNQHSPSLKWSPEPFPASGGLAAEGFVALLGQTGLHDLEILVRETAQNSWDARAGRSLVKMQFSGFELCKGSDGYRVLTDVIFRDRPSKAQFPALNAALGMSRINAILVRDWNTAGLGGATSAAIAAEPRANNRYRRFLLNVGEQQHPEHGGGAYGYGRSICFRLSRCRTAVIYSRTSDGLKNAESRLVAVGFGPSFNSNGLAYNGKHWWNNSGTAGSPIVGADADVLAGRLGIAPYGSQERGTSILILDPELDTSLSDAMESISLSVGLHLWPKYCIHRTDPGMAFEVLDNGHKLDVPDPGSHPTLKYFADALGLLKECRLDPAGAVPPLGNMKYFPIIKRKGSRDKTPVAHLVTIVHPRPTAPVVGNEVHSDEVPSVKAEIRERLAALNHHVALLRTPELVVRYHRVQAHSDEHLAIAGVLRSSDGAPNELLRGAEPPTHDDWKERDDNPEAKALVRRVKAEVEKLVKTEVDPIVVPPAQANDNDLAVSVGADLAALVWSEPGDGPFASAGSNADSRGKKSGGDSTGKRGTGGAQNRALSIGQPQLSSGVLAGEALSIWEITFGKAPAGRSDTYRIRLGLATGDGGSGEVEFLENASGPARITEVTYRLGAKSESNKEEKTELKLIVPGSTEGSVIVAVAFKLGTTPLLDISEDTKK
jgi:hypothetical protein